MSRQELGFVQHVKYAWEPPAHISTHRNAKRCLSRRLLGRHREGCSTPIISYLEYCHLSYYLIQELGIISTR